jgi:transcriptional regulator with XRE-family HTH domain
MAGFKQIDAADHANISQPYLSMIEHGKCAPSRALRDRLCMLYGLEVDKVEAAVKRGGPRLALLLLVGGWCV